MTNCLIDDKFYGPCKDCPYDYKCMGEKSDSFVTNEIQEPKESMLRLIYDKIHKLQIMTAYKAHIQFQVDREVLAAVLVVEGTKGEQRAFPLYITDIEKDGEEKIKQMFVDIFTELEKLS